MSSFPGSPKFIKSGLVSFDAASGAVKRSIALQYIPDSLSRSYQVQLRDGFLYTIEGNKSPKVQGFSYVFSRMDKLLGFGQVPDVV